MIFGYLDPGSSSLILQALLGGIAGVAVAFKAWKQRLAGKRHRADSDSGGNTTGDETPISAES